MINQTPEQIARDKIDRMLASAGWAVKSKNKVDLSAAKWVAVREYQTDIGPADYVLFVDRKPVGVVEAKREEEGDILISMTGSVPNAPQSLVGRVARVWKNGPRNVAIYLVRRLRNETLNKVGDEFRINKYSTVSSIVEKVKRDMRLDKSLKKRVGLLIDKIANGQ